MTDFNKNVVAVPFTNSIKQTINPGDEVVFVTSGYAHSVSIDKGTYLGRYKGENGGCVIKVYNPLIRFRHAVTGAEVQSWYTDKRITETVYPRMDYTYRYGTEEYEKNLAIYKAALAERQAIVDAVITEYEQFEVPAYRRTTLQRNRIFKIDTRAVDINI